METDRMRITIDKAEKIYIAGETIRGKIYLNILKRTKLQGKYHNTVL